MDSSLARQIRILQFSTVLLFLCVGVLIADMFRPFLPLRRFNIIAVHKVDVREADGTLKASLSNSQGFKVFGRAKMDVPFSGLMFYNQEGEEAAGLVYDGKKIGDGQRASLGLTFDQFRQDQNIYLHHDEYKDSNGTTISDGLAVNARPDYTAAKEEYQTYDRIQQLPPGQREEARLAALKEGKISTPRVFLGVQRGAKNGTAYDDSGLFIKNKWGQVAIKLFVDNNNEPHFEIYDPLGRKLVYQLQVPKS